jgi:cellulose synthase (UDP-forming)
MGDMQKSKLINNATLVVIVGFSTAFIYFCINYAYAFLHNGKYLLYNLFYNHILYLLIDHKIVIFLVEILWLFILYIIVKKYARAKFFCCNGYCI